MLSLLCNEFNKFNNTGARMIDLFIKRHYGYFDLAFWRTKLKSLPYISDVAQLLPPIHSGTKYMYVVNR